VHDSKLLRATLQNCLDRVPIVSNEGIEHLCMDKAYDSKKLLEVIEQEFGYMAHIRSRGEEAKRLKKRRGERPRRWVVERTHSWLNRFRGILVRWEKKAENYLANLQFACAYYTFKRIPVFG